MPSYDSISVKEYIYALKSLPDKYREVLVAQFQCPRHEVSAGQLARLIGYQRYSKGNLSYGHAAHLVCVFLNIAKPSFGQWFWAISDAYHNGKVWIWIMRPNLVEAIKQLGWAREQQYQTFFASPDEQATLEEFAEGRVQLVAVNVFERSAKARSACLRHYGCVCAACGFNFENFYGELGREFIHVHHIKPLAEIGEEYTVDPIKDMRPVCPNCHAMLHRKTPALTVDQLKKIIKKFRASASLR
jgi:5-methylcytosine-specific restriction enzyme A